MARKLPAEFVEKPWGRTALPELFGPTGGRRIGEVWFAGGDDLPLLAKYIFTDEKLSIQVHPDDEQAAARGLERGKSECWLILEAEPDAALGLGLIRSVDEAELRAAALDGSIEQLLCWHPVRSGDVFMVPAGTVHAIGAGISLLEFQQNSDVTYRLYDYGRPRELHLDEGVAVARAERYDVPVARVDPVQEGVLVDARQFTLAHATSASGIARRFEGKLRWVLPLEGAARSNGAAAGPGECLLLPPDDVLREVEGRALIGAPATS